MVAGLISIASPSHAATVAPGAGQAPEAPDTDTDTDKEAASRPAPNEAGASGSKLAGGGYSRPPPNPRIDAISDSRSLVASKAIRITGLSPSPRRSL